MPVDWLGDPVDVLLELPREPALADAARSRDRYEARPTIAPSRRHGLLQHAQLVRPTDERRLWQVRPALATTLRDHSERPPGWHRGCLALQDLVARRLERNRFRCRPVC